MREKQILTRLYVVVALLVVFSIAIGASLVKTQVSDGAKYRKLALERTEKIVTIEPSRGACIQTTVVYWLLLFPDMRLDLTL